MIRLCRFALVGYACVSLLRGGNPVVVRAVADATYAQRRAASTPPKPETYVFAKGQFFSGITYDGTLERTPFRRIAETLANDLRQQNYFPTPDLKSANLIIVVHWGVTMPSDRGAALMAFDPNIVRDAVNAIDEARQTEAEDLTFASSFAGVVMTAEANFDAVGSQVRGLYETNENRAQSTAELLGFTRALDLESNIPFDTETARTLRGMIDEERYFIIMIAYDGPALRAGKKHRLWTSRMSIRAPGVNFTTALDRLSNAGAPFHGTRQEKLAFAYVKDRPGIVKVGDLKVINDAPAKP